jgi:hypothetical protein
MQVIRRFAPSSEMFRGWMIALIVLGAAALVYGAAQYFSARQSLGQIAAETPQTVQLDGLEAGNAQQSAMSAIPFDVIRRHQAVEQQANQGLLFMGIGLVAAGGGWLGLEMRSRRKKRN